jgi:hypothetical protein
MARHRLLSHSSHPTRLRHRHNARPPIPPLPSRERAGERGHQHDNEGLLQHSTGMHDVVFLDQHLRCTKCGSRDVPPAGHSLFAPPKSKQKAAPWLPVTAFGGNLFLRRLGGVRANSLRSNSARPFSAQTPQKQARTERGQGVGQAPDMTAIGYLGTAVSASRVDSKTSPSCSLPLWGRVGVGAAQRRIKQVICIGTPCKH